ncbi:MAG: hypothetical protein NVS4B11_09270 [Ktedonobacteraceae bacterium]
MFNPTPACTKVPDPNASVWHPVSYWLCLAKVNGQPADFYDRDEGTKTDSSNIATNINDSPLHTSYTIIASGIRDTAQSLYPNILCILPETQASSEPPLCLGYPHAIQTQV